MVEVMKIMVTSFKRSHASTAALSAPKPVAGHSRPRPSLLHCSLACCSPWGRKESDMTE